MVTFKLSENKFVDFFDNFKEACKSKNNRHKSQCFLYFGLANKIPLNLEKQKILLLSELKYCLIYEIINYYD